MHKFNGQDEEKKTKTLPDKEQAEKHAYRLSSGNLAVPAEWIRGCIINGYINRAGLKQKTETKKRVSPRIVVQPSLIDLHMKEYEINKRSVSSGGIAKGTRDFCVRPLIPDGWKIELTIQTELDDSDADFKRNLELAGIDIGIGSNRMNGYGRFEVTGFERQS